MPFLTDATWPAGLLKIFEICRNEPQSRENRYYGPYTKLFTHCFGPESFDFFIAPQNPPSDLFPRDIVNFIVYLVVFNNQRRPVLFAEIKDGAWASRADLHFKADDQMRQRFDSMIVDSPLPYLWGLSLLGTSLRVYRGNIASGDVAPLFEDRPSPRRTLPRDFLEGVWNIDILSPEGFTKMKVILGVIVASVAALQ